MKARLRHALSKNTYNRNILFACLRARGMQKNNRAIWPRNTYLSIPEVSESQRLKGLLQLILIQLAVPVLVGQPVQLVPPNRK